MLREYSILMSPWTRTGGEVPLSSSLPDMHMRDMAAAFERLQSDLRDEILRCIHNREPRFFERLVIDVLLALGYGGRRRDLARCLGRRGDGGVDGVISTDELGLDQVYVQAKRLQPGYGVPVNEVRDFAGSLDAHRSVKGVFVTTSHFTAGAVEFCRNVSRRVALVDGRTLADMMIRHNIGVTVQSSFQLKRIDPSYFRPQAAAAERR